MCIWVGCSRGTARCGVELGQRGNSRGMQENLHIPSVDDSGGCSYVVCMKDVGFIGSRGGEELRLAQQMGKEDHEVNLVLGQQMGKENQEANLV